MKSYSKYFKNSFKLIVSLTVLMIVVSCCNENNTAVDDSIDYSKNVNWLVQGQKIDQNVDVFFVYPTIFGDPNMLLMDINDSSLRLSASYALKKQASIFNGSCNIFAPYYRQVSMTVLSMDEKAQDSLLAVGFGDVKKAFYYYLDSLNNGRPFFVAGHSQGSEMLLKLLKDKDFNDDIYKNMIAAYLIGYTVTDDDLKANPLLKLAQDSSDLGVIITYNTQAPGASGSPVLLEGANCINPISWSTNGELAQKENNLGAVFFTTKGELDSIVPEFTSARIDLTNGALIAAEPDPKDYNVIETFPPGIYHVFDYSFFYNNLKKNVNDRINAFEKNNK